MQKPTKTCYVKTTITVDFKAIFGFGTQAASKGFATARTTNQGTTMKYLLLILTLTACTTPYGQGHTPTDRCEHARYGAFDEHVEYTSNCKGTEKWAITF